MQIKKASFVICESIIKMCFQLFMLRLVSIQVANMYVFNIVQSCLQATDAIRKQHHDIRMFDSGPGWRHGADKLS